MAQTLIGRLQLIVQAQGLGEGKKIESMLNGIERNAKRLSASGGVGNWGINFQRQLDKLGVGGKNLDQLRSSWARLHDDMNSKSLNKALRGNEITGWKNATLGHFTAIRAGMREMEADGKRVGRNLETAMKPFLVAMGFYTAAYGGGLMIRGAVTSASDRSRVDSDTYFRGFSEKDRNRIASSSDEIAARRRVSSTDVREILADSAMNLKGGVDAALQTLDTQVQAFKLFANAKGSSPDAAIGQLRAFNRAMDNANITDPGEYNQFMSNFVKAWQITGKDIDAGDMEMAIKYARTGNKVYGQDFMSSVMPFIMAQSSGSDTGTALRALFDQWIVGRAPKNALAEQQKMGLRDKDGRVVGQEAFAINPQAWAMQYLLPALEKNGVDTANPTELARVIGKLTNNRLSASALTDFILANEQYKRLTEQSKGAKGLGAADEVDALSMSSAWAGLKTAAENLAAAVMPVESVINPGLMKLADGINAVTTMINGMDDTSKMMLGGAAAGLAGFAGWKMIAGFGALVTAGPSLQTAAVMLQGAAATMGGGGVDLPGGGKSKWGALSFLSKVGPWLAMLSLSGDTANSDYLNMTPEQRAAARAKVRPKVYPSHSDERERDTDGAFPMDMPRGPDSYYGRKDGEGAIRALANSLDRYLAGGTERQRHFPTGAEEPTPEVMEMARRRFGRSRYGGLGGLSDEDMDRNIAMIGEMKAKGAEMKEALSPEATPTVDTSQIDAAIAKAQQLIGILAQAGAAAARAGQQMNSQMRRTHSDFGVTP